MNDERMNETNPAEQPDTDLTTLGAPTAPTAKPKKSDKKRRPRVLMLILVMVAVIALALVLVFLTKSLPQTGDSSEESTAPTEYVLLKQTDGEGNAITITDLHITAPTGDLTFYTATTGELMLEGYEILKPRTTYIDLLVSALTAIVSQERLTVDAEHPLSSYGLEEPPITADIRFSDGTDVRLELGDMTPLADGYYLHNATDDTYHIVSTNVGLNLMQKATDYLDVTMFSSPAVDENDENGSVMLYGMTLSGTVRPQPLSFTVREADDRSVSSVYTYKLTAPYRHGVNSNAVQNITYFTSLSALYVYQLEPTAEDLAAVGLDDPYSICELTLAVETYDSEDEEQTSRYYNKQSHKLLIGDFDKETDCYYTLLDDVPVIYLVSSSSVEDFIRVQYTDLVDSLLFAQDITGVKSVTVGLEGESYDFNLEHFPDEELNDNKLKVTWDDETLSTPDFRSLYILMMQLTRSAEATEEQIAAATGTPALELSIRLADETTPLLDVEFFKVTSSLYLCRHKDTQEVYCVKASSIEKILQQTAHFLSGDHVSLG